MLSDVLLFYVQFTFCPIAYFMAGGSQSDHGTPFGVFVVIYFACSLTLSQMFRTVSWIVPNAVAAQALAGFLLLVLLLISGYVTPCSELPLW